MLKVGIIGGGPAGIFTALKISEFSAQVKVFEAGDYSNPRVGEHLVAEALHEFGRLGIPRELLVQNSKACSQVLNSWGRTDLHENPSVFNPFGDGFILSRPDFDHALMEYARSQGVDVQLNQRVVKAEKLSKGWRLYFANESIELDFVVDASGRNSKFKPTPEVGKELADQLIGITSYSRVTDPEEHGECGLMVEPLADGWWYSVQLQSGTWVGTFMTDAALLTGSDLSAGEFWQQRLMESYFTRKRFSASSCDKPIIQSAHSRRLSQTYGERWLSTGDAAISFDPLSSAGIIKGFRLGILAAETIRQWQQTGEEALLDYDTEVQRQYREYLTYRKEYYARESRWPGHAFWYHRNMWPKEIQDFSIRPEDELQVKQPVDEKALELLGQRLPDIDFKALIEAIQENPKAAGAMEQYLKHKGLGKNMPPYLLHALESLKKTRLIELQHGI